MIQRFCISIKTGSTFPFIDLLSRVAILFISSFWTTLFEIKLPNTPLNISTIPQSLEQVLINLLINAAQSVDKEDSYVQLVAKVKSKSDPAVVHIDILDNGCGIEGDNMSNIFKPFYSTKNKEIGLGLGLNITKKLTDDIGGKIEVKSDFGVGSRFRLILPTYTWFLNLPIWRTDSKL